MCFAACGQHIRCLWENFFIVTWMPDAEAAEAKIAALREEGDCVACCVDLAEEWNFG